MNDIRLIAMDMDGTLLDDDQRLSEANARALRDAMAQGIHIALCSGRMSGDLSLFASDAKLDGCHILGLNGACCLDKPHGEPYAARLLAPEALARCLEVLDAQRVVYACFQPGRILVPQPQAARFHWGSHQGRRGAPEYLYGPEAMNAHRAEGACKLVYVEEADMARLERIREELLPTPGLDVTSSWSNNLELMPVGVNKGAAVRELAMRLGLTSAQVMTLGDYDNDLSMIEYAGWGVAMGNASERVQKAARRVTLSNTEDGVAHAIRELALD